MSEMNEQADFIRTLAGMRAFDGTTPLMDVLTVPCRACHGTSIVPKSRAEAIAAAQDWCVEQGWSFGYNQFARRWFVDRRTTLAIVVAMDWGSTLLDALHSALVAEWGTQEGNDG